MKKIIICILVGIAVVSCTGCSDEIRHPSEGSINNHLV